MASTIFEKQASLKPSAMRTVAERRFDDAEALRKTKDNARANGVAYLVGFVIEILLKAKLVEKFSRIAKTPRHLVKDDEREVWSLIWRRHDLDAMLLKMTELQANLKKKGERDGSDYVGQLKVICTTWTIQARYSSELIAMDEAAGLLERVRVLKELLK
ncbi:MAG TPA: hypothetical protein VFC46_15835 [Humisphaera sp.]|nr:hypothetical protein [Humisphaera sp.]